MEWIAAAIVFCFLMWKWPRNTIIGILSICVLTAITMGGIWIKAKYDQAQYEERRLAYLEQQRQKQIQLDAERAAREAEKAMAEKKFLEKVTLRRFTNREGNCFRHYNELHHGHANFYVVNDNDKDIKAFKIHVTATQENHSKVILDTTYSYDLIVPKNGSTGGFCIDFVADSDLRLRVPLSKADAQSMRRVRSDLIDVNDIEFKYEIIDIEHD